MATTTRQYLDKSGLEYLLSKLTSTTNGTGTVVTNVTQEKGKVVVTKGDVSGMMTDTEKDNIIKNVNLAGTTSVQGATTTLSWTTLKGTTGSTSTYIPFPVTGSTGYIKETGTILDIDSSKIVMAGGTGADTNLTSKGYVDAQITQTITSAVEYKGGTSTLPTDAHKGDMYKLLGPVVVAGATGKVGDTIIYSGTAWDLIPSGDDVEYTGIKVGGTTAVSETGGGYVNFAGGTNTQVVRSGATGAATVTISHATPSGATSLTTQAIYKFKTDAQGHVIGATAVDLASETINRLNANVDVVNPEDGTAAGPTGATGSTAVKKTTIYDVKQTNGLIAQDSANTVVFQSISNAEIDGLFL